MRNNRQHWVFGQQQVVSPLHCPLQKYVSSRREDRRDKQPDRHKQTGTDRQVDCWTFRYRLTQTDTDRQTDSQRDRHMQRKTADQTVKQTD